MWISDRCFLFLFQGILFVSSDRCWAFYSVLNFGRFGGFLHPFLDCPPVFFCSFSFFWNTAGIFFQDSVFWREVFSFPFCLLFLWILFYFSRNFTYNLNNCFACRWMSYTHLRVFIYLSKICDSLSCVLYDDFL